MNNLNAEQEWMAVNGYQYLDSDESLLEVEIEYEEDDFKSLDYYFRDVQFPSLEDWSYYTNESWD